MYAGFLCYCIPLIAIIQYFPFLNIQVQVLFEETFFNSNNQSFPVLCIDQPLEGGIGTVINLACYMYNMAQVVQEGRIK